MDSRTRTCVHRGRPKPGAHTAPSTSALRAVILVICSLPGFVCLCLAVCPHAVSPHLGLPPPPLSPRSPQQRAGSRCAGELQLLGPRLLTWAPSCQNEFLLRSWPWGAPLGPPPGRHWCSAQGHAGGRRGNPTSQPPSRLIQEGCPQAGGEGIRSTGAPWRCLMP